MKNDLKLKLDRAKVKGLVKLALQEDLDRPAWHRFWFRPMAGRGDVTAKSTITRDKMARGIITSKADGIIAGLVVAELVFKMAGGRGKVEFETKVQDGAEVNIGDTIAEVYGNARAILLGERTALNFLGHLSGIATLTRRFVEAVHGQIPIFDTRKTTPGLRYLEKYAVRCGGGQNHRMGLYDAVLIKDNHIKLQGSQDGKIKTVVASARREAPGGMAIEVEASNLKQVEEVIEAGADIIMLDNMGLETIKEAVKLIHRHQASGPPQRGESSPSAGIRHPAIEVSGGITLNNVNAIARAGVDLISVGALTHSAPALDVSLDIEMPSYFKYSEPR